MKVKIISKRAISLLVIFMIIITSLTILVNATSPVLLSVSSATGIRDTDITISVNISAGTKLGAAGLFLKYDNTELTWESSSAGSAAAGGLTSINEAYDVEGNLTTINDSFVSYFCQLPTCI